MRGHEKLIELRKSGVRPSIVFLNDFPCKTDWFEDGDKHVTVCVDGENLDRVDLRFLVGLTVSATSYDESRAKALMTVCQKAGASVVGAGHAKEYPQTGGWCEVWRKEILK
jgi:hypothetical protein